MTAKLSQSDTRFERAGDFLRRLELPGDAMLLIYFAVFARQYLWWTIDNNWIAWITSVVVGGACVSLYVLTKPREADSEDARRVNLPFWLIAVLPIAFVYCARVVFPDVSFDVLNYRIFHAERALTGLLYLPGDFFPTPAPYNPAPDMVTGIFRHVLGYRLGTIANLLAMIWAAQIIEKLLRPFFRNAWLRAGAVLLAVSAEHLLFEVNNYMADLLALPLLLEATHLAIFNPSRGSNTPAGDARNLVCIALLLGMSVAFKLTNASVALPIVLLCAYSALKRTRQNGNPVAGRVKQLALTTLLSAIAFLAPLLPFSFYLYRDTGSPVFPVFNGIFKSVYWPPHSIWDPRWGPVGLWETLLWPIKISFNPERLSELAVYSGKISFGFVVAILGFVLVRHDKPLRELYLLFVGGALLWSGSTGYIRYALNFEILAALVVLTLAAKLVRQATLHRIGLAIACLLVAGLTFQVVLGLYYTSQHEWSQRPTIFTMPGPYLKEARHLFRDHSLRPFLQTDTLQRVDDVGVWIGNSIKTSAITVMLRPDVPTIGVNQGEYFANSESRERFKRALEGSEGKRMFSLVLNENLAAAKLILRDRGLVVVNVEPVDIPYYSPRVRIGAALLELKTVKAYNLEKENK